MHRPDGRGSQGAPIRSALVERTVIITREQASQGLRLSAWPLGPIGPTLTGEPALESITIVLALLLAVVLSGVLSRLLPFHVPRPLVQIALGGIIGMIADWRVVLDPEIFFLLFLPPLLFLDGWRIPREELFRDASTSHSALCCSRCSGWGSSSTG
jgi:hypothetical protein